MTVTYSASNSHRPRENKEHTIVVVRLGSGSGPLRALGTISFTCRPTVDRHTSVLHLPQSAIRHRLPHKLRALLNVNEHRLCSVLGGRRGKPRFLISWWCLVFRLSLPGSLCGRPTASYRIGYGNGRYAIEGQLRGLWGVGARRVRISKSG